MSDGVICMMPWIHMHAWPDGNVFPCCMSDIKYPIGKWPQRSLKEIWNGEEMRSLRLRMLNGQKSEHCNRCYTLEQNGFYSLRNHSNEIFSHHTKKQNSTLPDGSAGDINMAYLDVRFSNICNLKCRTCGPELSSAWYDDSIKLSSRPPNSRIIDINKDGQFFSELEPYLRDTEEVMFAGGESIITDEHYRILDYWIDHGMTDVRLKYTTNFSNFRYKNRDLFKMWSKFSFVHVSASLDGSYERGEYLRKGIVWNDIVDNRKRMIEEIPSAEFQITPTVSLMNVIHLPDFHKEWIELELAHVDDLRLNLLTEPAYMSVKVLPSRLKDVARDRIMNHIEWLTSIGGSDSTISQWQSVITYMDSGDDSRLRRDFHRFTDHVDMIRSESFADIFPELEELYD